MGFRYTNETLKARIRDGVQRWAPEFNRKGWYGETSDDTDVTIATLKTAFYGKSLIGADDLFALMDESDDFANFILEPMGKRIGTLASAKVDAEPLKADLDRGIAIIQGVSFKIGRAIEAGGGDKRKDAA
ncbi:MAG: hypothetical protein IH904_04655 [Proteobacteria bacterium]|nr:hypothetical protein [Pseudomonadota bacterium]